MILDTCALLWLAGGDHDRLTSKTLSEIDTATRVSVSAVSGFEVGIKHRAGKLQLPVSAREWFDEILRFHHIDVIDLDLNICIRATELPPIHKDPCDRLIIATALTLDLPVVTADTRFADYGATVWR